MWLSAGYIRKSIVASWLAEFLIGRGQPVRCIDGDPVNRSLAQMKALNVEKLDLLNDEGVVMRSRYDALINRFLTEETVFLVDSGATAFLPFWASYPKVGFIDPPRLVVRLQVPAQSLL